MPKVSVIMPVYNTEAYLKEALDSLCKQTLYDIEIICVDDGSTDGSLHILKEYAEKESRLHIFHQDNCGAGVARNYGLSLAKGEYVVFLDSDDIFYSNLMEEAYDKAKKEKADIVIYRFNRYDEVTGEKKAANYAFKNQYWPDGVFSYKDNPDKIFNSFNPCAWNKFYRREFITGVDITFQNIKRSNDVFFTESSVVCAKRIALLDKCLVDYRVGNGATSQMNKNSTAPTDFYLALKKLKDFLEEHKLLDLVYASYEELVEDTFIHNIKSSYHKSLPLYELWFQKASKILVRKTSPKMQDFLQGYDGAKFQYQYSLDLQPRQLEIEILPKVEKPNVTVVISVYNASLFLAACLESVCSQTLDNIEIICVDDGSTDKSEEIIQNFINKDSRIGLIKENNGGPAWARNTGASYAKGTYLYFMDDDDLLEIDALEKLYKYAEQEELDLLCFDATSFFENNELKNQQKEYVNYYHRLGNYRLPQAGIDLFTEMMKKREFRYSTPLQFFRRAFFVQENLGFLPGIIHEDVEFSFKAMLLAKRAAHFSEILYHRRLRPNSIMTTRKGFKHFYGLFKSSLAIEKLAKTMNLKLEQKVFVQRLLDNILDEAKAIYANFSEKEKAMLLSLSPQEQDALNRTIQELNEPTNFIAKLRKKIGKAVQCYKENGLSFTLYKIKNALLQR